MHCGICQTPKECIVPAFGRKIKARCVCACEKQRYERERAEAAKRRRDERIAELRRDAFPDKALAGCTFDRDDGGNKAVTEVCKAYAQKFREAYDAGKGLLLYGPVGTGKTFLAACVANAVIEQNRPCLVTTISRLTNTLFALDDKQGFLDGLNEYHLMVIDDLSAERDTEFMNEQVYNIIDGRYRVGLPLIVTTNITAAEMRKPGNIHRNRIYSRLLEMCVPVEVGGADRRLRKNDFTKTLLERT